MSRDLRTDTDRPSQADRTLLAILRELILIKKVGFVLIVMLGLVMALVVLAVAFR